jgi:predicted dehydrogenase
MAHTKNVNVGLVGLGYWGPKVMRNFMVTPRAEVTAFCDMNKQRLDSVHHPGALKTANYDELLAAPNVDAVVLCVPTDMHYPFAKKALEAGKHVWVEKPTPSRPPWSSTTSPRRRG